MLCNTATNRAVKIDKHMTTWHDLSMEKMEFMKTFSSLQWTSFVINLVQNVSWKILIDNSIGNELSPY